MVFAGYNEMYSAVFSHTQTYEDYYLLTTFKIKEENSDTTSIQ